MPANCSMTFTQRSYGAVSLPGSTISLHENRRPPDKVQEMERCYKRLSDSRTKALRVTDYNRKKTVLMG